MRKVELLPTRDCEAGYGPAELLNIFYQNHKILYGSDPTILFNFTSMWFKYLSNNVWRDFGLPITASTMVT